MVSLMSLCVDRITSKIQLKAAKRSSKPSDEMMLFPMGVDDYICHYKQMLGVKVGGLVERVHASHSHCVTSLNLHDLSDLLSASLPTSAAA